ncbi:MAG: hypothetical protein BWY28_02329 [bacterium ADurb.Bin236]|nr:MAG: hypothetical protein BWY28_02329 [bacterium ADurb.Bin236]
MSTLNAEETLVSPCAASNVVALIYIVSSSSRNAPPSLSTLFVNHTNVAPACGVATPVICPVDVPALTPVLSTVPALAGSFILA